MAAAGGVAATVVEWMVSFFITKDGETGGFVLRNFTANGLPPLLLLLQDIVLVGVADDDDDEGRRFD